MPDPAVTAAVFLSYAREDAELARHIAEALRAFGVEVWFDQDELRGGDTWDTKIRNQIKTCALFVPLISQRTEERTEGYFRREWKLAVDRTHDMAGRKAFIVPVVIDETREADAAVPEEFMRYQWTRLAHGVPTPEFVTQVKRLLEAPRKAAAATRPAQSGMGVPPMNQTHGQDARATPEVGRRVPAAAWIALAAVVAIGLAATFFATRQAGPASSPTPNAGAGTRPPTAEKTAAAAPAPSAKSLAVLPFANLSTEKENEFFADGMHDDLITALAKIRDLKVISRTSVMPYKSGERNLRKIAGELGVATVRDGRTCCR